MKPTFINIRVLGTTALALLFATSCSDILDEQPRSIYEPTFFQTEKGVEGGITSMYAPYVIFTDKHTITIHV